MNEIFGPLLHCIVGFLCPIASSICRGIVTGFPLGVLVGVLFGPARVSGVDFRQWFWDPTQPNQEADDSWIALVRNTAHYLALAALAALLVSSVWQWFCPICWNATINGVLPFIADCLLFWFRWNDIVGILVGIASAQLIAEGFWWLGLRLLPQLTARQRPLIRHLHVGAGAAATPPPPPPALGARRPGRRLIICCDGTWNWPQPALETNVVRLLRAIKSEAQPPHPPVAQISYYQLGVGTGNILDRIVGGGAGIGLANSVKACYGFLVDNYAPGDEILLFGFSRGAYVARSIAGMVGAIGLLHKEEMAHFYEVWDAYSALGSDYHPAYARQLPDQINLQCIGVWDTVGALGIPGTRFCAKQFTFHDTALGPHVRHAFQALAIDERRGIFQAAPWVPTGAAEQVLEQVWFPGVHSNVGGGYLQHGLSDTTLLWMVSQILEHELLDLDTRVITRALDKSEPYAKGKLENSRTFWWRLLGSPVPRPVGTTYAAEKIHESVTEYGQGVYAGTRRQQWVRDCGLDVFRRTRFEVDHAIKARGAAEPPPPWRPSRIGLCDRIMQLLGGSG